jgi:hypothetical protein
VRLLRDPQQWGNKWLTQTLHILNSTAKGGIVAETDFFEDQRQAEDTWARPDAITWARRGALSGQHGPKFVAKPGQGSFEGYIDLLDLAINATRDVSGINLELLGQKDINQPGILEAMRKQAGMTVLATMFDALRRMRKIIGRIRLFYIQNYLSDGRIIRIIGQDGKKSMRLLRDRTLGEYDVIVDDTPTSPNQKQANWGIISTLLPLFKDQLMARPDVLIKLLEYSPLPTALIEAVRQTMAGPTPQSPIQQQMQQLQLSAATAKISKDQAQAELFMKQAGATETTAMYDMAMAQNLMLKHRNDLVAALNEARASGIESAKQAAQTDHFSAKADVERARAAQIRTQTVGDEANIHHTNARTDMAHAQAHRERVGALIDALTPIPHEPPVQGDAGNGQQAPVLQTP